MTARAETRALRQPPAMNLFADHRKIHLRMAAQTQIIITRNEHFGMHGSVDLMAGYTAFADRLMFKDKRATLLFVTVEAGLVDSF